MEILGEAVFDSALEFVSSMTPLTFAHEVIESGGGCFVTFRPTVIVTRPARGSADFSSTVVALFHEYGHWMDFRCWTERNLKWDRHDGIIAKVLRNSQELDPEKVDEYLQRRSIFDEEVGAYHRFLINEGIMVGDFWPNHDAILAHETRAWTFANEGMKIGEKYYAGFRVFVEKCELIIDKKVAEQTFDRLRYEMFETYRKQAESTEV